MYWHKGWSFSQVVFGEGFYCTECTHTKGGICSTVLNVLTQRVVFQPGGLWWGVLLYWMYSHKGWYLFHCTECTDTKGGLSERWSLLRGSTVPNVLTQRVVFVPLYWMYWHKGWSFSQVVFGEGFYCTECRHKGCYLFHCTECTDTKGGLSERWSLVRGSTVLNILTQWVVFVPLYWMYWHKRWPLFHCTKSTDTKGGLSAGWSFVRGSTVLNVLTQSCTLHSCWNILR